MISSSLGHPNLEEVTHLRKKILTFMIISIMVIGLSACNLGDRDLTRGDTTYDQNFGRNVTPYTYDGGTRDYPYDRYGTRDRYGTMDELGGNMNRVDRTRGTQFQTNANRDADQMATLAARNNGVQDATVVIAGGNAYVALDLDDKIQRNRAETVERAVYNSLSRYANRYNVSITSDADLFGRLRDIGDGVRDGAPLDRYQTDFRDFDNRFRTFTR